MVDAGRVCLHFTKEVGAVRITRRERRTKKLRMRVMAAAGAVTLVCSFALKVALGFSETNVGELARGVVQAKDERFPALNPMTSIITPMPTAQALISPSQAREDENAASIATIAVWDHREKMLREMPLDEYVYHCLSAEVPASYHEEALKAQAVAIRTYAVGKMAEYGGYGCNKAQNAAVCTDSSHCQAYANDDVLIEKWGNGYDSNSQKMKKAVDDTSGLLALYDGKPILAMFHANSGGITEDVEAVYSNALPYLRSVEGHDPQSEAVRRFTAKEAAEIINKEYPQANVRANRIAEELIVKTRLASGRVEAVICGDIELTGTQLRKLFSLSSSNLIIRYPQGDLEFTVYGRGHGVGLSQEGAQEMAKNGRSYEEILMHYYQGIEIGPVSMTR